MEVDDILKLIKDNGLTAYGISKEVPLTEAGLLKLLKGESTPKPSTIAILGGYLTEKYLTNATPTQNKTPNNHKDISLILDKSIFNDQSKMDNFVRFLSRNHKMLMEDELYQLYAARVVKEDENKKRAEQLTVNFAPINIPVTVYYIYCCN